MANESGIDEKQVSDMEKNFQLDSIASELISFAGRFKLLLGLGLVAGLLFGIVLFAMRPETYFGVVELRMAGYSSAANIADLVTVKDAGQSLTRLSYGNNYADALVDTCMTPDDRNPDKLATNIARGSKVLRPDTLRVKFVSTEPDRIAPCLEGVVKALSDWQAGLLERRLEPVKARITKLRQDLVEARKALAVPVADPPMVPVLFADQSVPFALLAALSNIEMVYPVTWPTEVVDLSPIRQEQPFALIVKLVFGGSMAGFCVALLMALLYGRIRRARAT